MGPFLEWGTEYRIQKYQFQASLIESWLDEKGSLLNVGSQEEEIPSGNTYTFDECVDYGYTATVICWFLLGVWLPKITLLGLSCAQRGTHQTMVWSTEQGFLIEISKINPAEASVPFATQTIG